VRALHRLRELGKKLYLVSNNSTTTIEEYQKRLHSYGLDIKPVSVSFDATGGDLCLPVRGEIGYRRYTVRAVRGCVGKIDLREYSR
jgi:MoaA/NifB/PqqE/SkfB family radical SAM enzyme